MQMKKRIEEKETENEMTDATNEEKKFYMKIKRAEKKR